MEHVTPQPDNVPAGVEAGGNAAKPQIGLLTEDAAAACAHHWLVDSALETPRGRPYRAVCKKCGGVRTFPRSPREIPYGKRDLARRRDRELSYADLAA